MSLREPEILGFLNQNTWSGAARNPVPGDASARRYERLWHNGKRAVLMDSPFCPKSVSDYAKTGRLAGNNTAAFVCIAHALSMRGFGAPKILAADIERGLVLLEDLGDDLVAKVLARAPEREEEVYTRAVEVAAAIYRSSFEPKLNAFGARWSLGPYDFEAFMAEADLFLDWYIDGPLSETARTQWREIWCEVLKPVFAFPAGLALRDYHAENIFWHENKTGLAQIGLIDFQDAVFTHPAYDLVSLLEDARRDVSEDIVPQLIAHFCACAKIENDADFRAAYSVLGAQRNAKILGIFVRLSKRDNKHQYLEYLPRVRAHFSRDLKHPALKALESWVRQYAPSAVVHS